MDRHTHLHACAHRQSNVYIPMYTPLCTHMNDENTAMSRHLVRKTVSVESKMEGRQAGGGIFGEHPRDPAAA